MATRGVFVDHTANQSAKNEANNEERRHTMRICRKTDKTWWTGLARVVFVVAFAWRSTGAFAESAPESASAGTKPLYFRWMDPDAEKQWTSWMNRQTRLTTGPRTTGVDPEVEEALLENFGARLMPKTYARYLAARATAEESRQTLNENFPKRVASDTTGGELYQKFRKKCALDVAKMFRCHDELCFFLLLHRAGVFSDAVVAKYDERGGPWQLAPEEENWLAGEAGIWPDDTPAKEQPLPEADAKFAVQHLPATLAAYQSLEALYDAGVEQYRDLRITALTVDATRGRKELELLLVRLRVLRQKLQTLKTAISGERLRFALGETSAEQAASLDSSMSTNLREFEKEMSVQKYFAQRAKAGTRTLTLPGGATMEMVWCPPGRFAMGSPTREMGRFDDELQHEVTLTEGFWMAKTEVTQKQWKSVMGTTMEQQEDKINGLARRQAKKTAEAGAALSLLGGNLLDFFAICAASGEIGPDYKAKGDNYPMRWVQKSEAEQFCEKAGMLLPTEAQWEYACRAGSQGPYEGGGDVGAVGWVPSEEIHQVGLKKPNAWGLHDMHGNVYEFCRDGYGEYGKDEVMDPVGSGSYIIIRSGGRDEQDWRYFRSACRFWIKSDMGCDLAGFRPIMVDGK